MTAAAVPPAPRTAAPRYHPLAAVFAAVAAGAVAERLLHVDWRLSLAGAAVCLVGWARHREGAAWLLLAVALAAAAGHHAAWRLAAADAFDLRLSPKATAVVVRVQALDSPTLQVHRAVTARGERHWRLLVSISAARDGRRWRAARGRAELSFPVPAAATPGISAGDRLLVFGEAQLHRPAANPGDWDPSKSSRTRRQCLLRADAASSVTIESRAAWWSPRRLVAGARRRVEAQLRRHIPPGQADLATALLLGRRELLSVETRGAFIDSGTAHLLALSGLHVGLLAGLVWMAGRFGLLSRRATCAAAALAAVGYLVLAGPRASLVRAAVLIVAVAWARWIARPRAVWNTLSLAALLLAACDPIQLFDTGAQLSFLAVAALCRWGGGVKPSPPEAPLQRLIDQSRGPLRRWSRWAAQAAWRWLLVSAVVWMVTAPVVAWRFGRLAPIGICLNPLVGPLVAGALYAEVGAVACGPWSSWLGRGFGSIAGVLLHATLALAAWAARLPGGHFEITPLPASWAACGCALWFTWAFCPRRPVVLATMTVLWLAWAAHAQLPARWCGLRCTVLAVGHGTCIVIRTPAGDSVIYDAGRLGGGRLAARAALRCLARQRIRRIRRLIISHQDADHYNAVPTLMERLAVDEICVGPRMLTPHEAEGGVHLLRERIRAHRVPVLRISAGTSWAWEPDLTVEVLHPPTDWQGGAADNADSLVLRLTHRGRAILLTGDVEGAGLERLMERRRLRADVLLAPHHGSPRSRPDELADKCGAKWLIVSGGDSAVMPAWRRGSVLHTAVHGAIQVTIDRMGLTVRSWRHDPW